MEDFKDQLTLDDILHGLPYKMLLELRDARAERLERERKKQTDLDRMVQSQNIQKQILDIYGQDTSNMITKK